VQSLAVNKFITSARDKFQGSLLRALLEIVSAIFRLDRGTGKPLSGNLQRAASKLDQLAGNDSFRTPRDLAAGR